MKKIILGGIVTLVLLLIVGLVVAAFSLDSLVKRGIETAGPKFTKVDVKLDEVKLSLLSGDGRLGGLVIGNPDGFKTPHAISLGTAQLAIQPSSLLSGKIVIRTVRVEAPEITLETGLNGTNLKKILANVQETTGGDGTNAPASPAAPAPKNESAGKKFEVGDFLITGAKLNFSVTGLGSQSVTLPEIHLTDLGKGTDGLTGAELTQQVLTAVEKAAAKVASESAGTIAKGATGLVKGLAGKTNSAALENLGGLFKKK